MERADVEAIATYLLTAADGTIPPAKAPPAPLPGPEPGQPVAE